jgi:hypothetical protein
LIFDTRWDLIKAGFFPEDSDLRLDQMKEALDSPCMVGTPSYKRAKLVKMAIYF